MEIALADHPDILSTSSEDIDNLESAYLELEKLETAFASGNFGFLIGRQADQITERDITVIKNKLLQILINNPFLRGENFQGKSGAQNMRLLGTAIGHGIEAVLLSALTTVLAGVAGVEVLHGDFILGALAGLGAVFTGAGVALQVKTIKALWAAYRLVKIMDAYEHWNHPDPEIYRRGLFRTFLDWIEGKTTDQIRREAERRIQAEGARRQHGFEEKINHLPNSFPYRDSKGIVRQYPTYKLFEFD